MYGWYERLLTFCCCSQAEASASLTVQTQTFGYIAKGDFTNACSQC